MRRLLREPLLHFLLGGALLFVLYGSVANESPQAPDRIVIDEARVASLAATFERTWLRPPTADELDGLVRDFVDEEILYREGLALGLDRDDLVVRRRLRQKVEFLHMDLVEREKPTEAELSAYLSDHRERFRDPARLSFRQLFVSPDAGYPAARQRADELLSKLRTGVSQAELEGDPTLLPRTMRKVSQRDVASVFGAGFAGDVAALTGDEWTGPVASSYGLHLVRVDERVPARMPELEQIRRPVELEYEAVQRAEANQRFLQELRERYEVEIRMPRLDSTPQLASVGG
jgi:hypothetical protein